MEQRREIDGLRALAVLPVLLFHSGFEGFSGGFVGVDVFFVISGYLITSIILEELEQGKFSLINFYERRARRILPALFFVIFACLPFAWVLLLPPDMKSFSQGLVAVTFFVSNILFWKTSGYFGAASELNPLLHTWSLAVEAQYYVFYSLFLLLAWKLRRRWLVTILIFIAIFSLGVAHWGSLNRPLAGFFLLPTRVWELLLGGFIYFYNSSLCLVKPNIGIKQVGSLFGFTLILFSIFYFSKETPSPSFYMLAPTLGTSLIILFATKDTLIGQILGSRVLVFFGLISYSTYLWHQPIFAFLKYKTSAAPDKYLILIFTIIIFLISYFSYKYVEVPFRNRNIYNLKKFKFYGISCSLFFISIGIFGIATDGFINRFPTLKGYYRDSLWPYNYNLDESCIKKYGGDQYCKIGDINKDITDALIGDSHSNHFYFGLNEYLKSRGRNLIQQGAGGCPPFFDIDWGRHPNQGLYHCYERTNHLYRAILDNPTVSTVYLSFHHSAYFNVDYHPTDVVNKLSSNLSRKDFIRLAIFRTISQIEAAGKKTVIFYDMPDLKKDEPEKCLLIEGNNVAQVSACNKNIFVDDFDIYNSIINEIETLTNAQVFRSDKYLKYFPRSNFGDWFYRDNTHLSLKGSMFFSDKYDF
jgi:peptidoglycan/LPS O-acetylase OafA/YrhL